MTADDIFNLVVGHAREVLPQLENQPIEMEDSLKGLGANSIDRSEIVMMTLESLDARIPLIELAGATNIGELVNILHAKLQAA